MDKKSEDNYDISATVGGVSVQLPVIKADLSIVVSAALPLIGILGGVYFLYAAPSAPTELDDTIKLIVLGLVIASMLSAQVLIWRRLFRQNRTVVSIDANQLANLAERRARELAEIRYRYIEDLATEFNRLLARCRTKMIVGQPPAVVETDFTDYKHLLCMRLAEFLKDLADSDFNVGVSIYEPSGLENGDLALKLKTQAPLIAVSPELRSSGFILNLSNAHNMEAIRDWTGGVIGSVFVTGHTRFTDDFQDKNKNPDFVDFQHGKTGKPWSKSSWQRVVRSSRVSDPRFSFAILTVDCDSVGAWNVFKPELLHQLAVQAPGFRMRKADFYNTLEVVVTPFFRLFVMVYEMQYLYYKLSGLDVRNFENNFDDHPVRAFLESHLRVSE